MDYGQRFPAEHIDSSSVLVAKVDSSHKYTQQLLSARCKLQNAHNEPSNSWPRTPGLPELRGAGRLWIWLETLFQVKGFVYYLLMKRFLSLHDTETQDAETTGHQTQNQGRQGGQGRTQASSWSLPLPRSLAWTCRKSLDQGRQKGQQTELSCRQAFRSACEHLVHQDCHKLTVHLEGWDMLYNIHFMLRTTFVT